MTNDTPLGPLREVAGHDLDRLVETARAQAHTPEQNEERIRAVDSLKGEIVGLRISVTFWREKYQELARQVEEWNQSAPTHGDKP